MPVLANKVRNGPPNADHCLSTANQTSDDSNWCYRWQANFACFYLIFYWNFISYSFDTKLCGMGLFSMTLYAMGLFKIRL